MQESKFASVYSVCNVIADRKLLLQELKSRTFCDGEAHHGVVFLRPKRNGVSENMISVSFKQRDDSETSNSSHGVFLLGHVLLEVWHSFHTKI